MFSSHLVAATLAQAAPAETHNLTDLILGSDPVVQFVLLLLVLFSVASWGIIAWKLVILSRVGTQNQAFLNKFWESERLEDAFAVLDKHELSPAAQVFKAGYRELRRLTEGKPKGAENLAPDAMNNLLRAMRRAKNSQGMSLESALPVLATIASSSPFIGLFGTVWGIMRAFQKIGITGAATLATVGGPISEALIATAVGLFAAIPAVMGYNYFSSRVRRLLTDTENFSSDFLNIVQRHFVKG